MGASQFRVLAVGRRAARTAGAANGNSRRVLLRACLERGSGTFVRSTLRAVPAKVPDPLFKHALIDYAAKVDAFSPAPAPSARAGSSHPHPARRRGGRGRT